MQRQNVYFLSSVITFAIGILSIVPLPYVKVSSMRDIDVGNMKSLSISIYKICLALIIDQCVLTISALLSFACFTSLSIDKALSGAVAVNWYVKLIALLCLSLQPLTRNMVNTNRNMISLLFMSLYLGQSYAIFGIAANI